MTFYELEKLCKQRRKKRRIFVIGSVFFALFLVGLIGAFHNTKKIKTSKTKTDTIKKSVAVKKEVKTKVKIKKEITKRHFEVNLNVKKHNMILSPVISLNIADVNISETNIPNTNIQNTSNKTYKEKNVSFITDNTYIKTSNIKPKKTLDKIYTSDDNVITTEVLPSYNDCIYKAEKALKNGNYALAMKWAQNANLINKTRPEAWIVSAKVLYLKGKKQKAINILKLYLKFNKNKEIKEFLQRLENEKNN